MSGRISKKEVADMAGVSLRTMQRRPRDYEFLARCRSAGTGRPTFSARLVEQQMRRRRMI